MQVAMGHSGGCLQVAVDTGCATVAEVQKRGKDFWNEFELYMSDLLVGLALDVALVGMLAPVVSFAAQGAVGTGLSAGLLGHLAALPSRWGGGGHQENHASAGNHHRMLVIHG
jgi:hypothetical protein